MGQRWGLDVPQPGSVRCLSAVAVAAADWKGVPLKAKVLSVDPPLLSV